MSYLNNRLRNLVIRRRRVLQEMGDIHPLALTFWRNNVRHLEAQIRGEVLLIREMKRK